MRSSYLLQRLGLTFAVPVITAMTWGCATTAPTQSLTGDEFGRTYYIDGAGNWGYGVREVAEGLRRAGYQGRIINWTWSPTLNPALDQTVGRPFARARGRELGEDINAYARQYPDKEVHIIALSAGTGVATWACESLRPPARVHNLILLGSSLSSDYDFRAALSSIEGGVWVYHSDHDAILLGPVRALGTIDGKVGADGAGLVGLHPHTIKTDKIHNIGWTDGYRRLGWSGSHTDATSEPFVRHVLARHIVAPSSEGAVKLASASDSPEGSDRSGPTVAADAADPAPLLATR